MTLALLCSGQGNQHADMFRVTAAVPAAQALFTHAASLIGCDPRALVVDGTKDIFENRPAQVLCALQALAAHTALRDVLPRRLCVAGYSVGEVAAWGVAQVYAPEATLELAAARADAMTQASRGIPAARNTQDAHDAGVVHGARHTEDTQGMLFVRGLPEQQIARLCDGRDAALAIVNPGEGYVIGGMRDVLDLIAAEAQREGAANVASINVAVASHTRFLAGAAAVFDRQLNATRHAGRIAPGVRLFSGIDGAAVFDVGAGIAKLARQIEETIHWDACLQACVEAGATAFLELGPGRALAAMAKTAHPAIAARSMDEFQDLAGARAWLARIFANRA